jgi:hypothetical protein
MYFLLLNRTLKLLGLKGVLLLVVNPRSLKDSTIALIVSPSAYRVNASWTIGAVSGSITNF